MNKSRLEALSDGVFSIVMTILVFSIKVPTATPGGGAADLWSGLVGLGPLLLSYFVSFLVLAMFWLSHHFFYSVFTKNIDRVLAMLNILYLSFIALIPFSAQLLGTYPELSLSGVVYGVNLIIVSMFSLIVIRYAMYSDEIDTAHIEEDTLRRATLRIYLTIVCSAIGVGAALIHNDAALLFFALPIVFNVTPGLLNALIRVLDSI